MPIITDKPVKEISYNSIKMPMYHKLQDKSITPTESTQTVTADSGNDGLGVVTINPINANYVGSSVPRKTQTNLTVSGATVTVPSGYYATEVSKSVATGTAGTPSASKGTVSNNQVTVTPSVTNTTGYISGGTKTGTGVVVKASDLVSGSETKNANGTYNVTNLAEIVVSVLPKVQEKTVSPTESKQEVVPDSTYDALSKVTINPISSTYVGSGISRKTSTNLTSSGATVTVPSGYYESEATKTISSGSVAVSKPTVNASGLVTASATVTAGYIGSSPSNNTLQLTTKAGTTITPNDSQQTAISSGTYATGNILVSAVPTETLNITENDTYTPSTGKYFSSVTVNVQPKGIVYQDKTITPIEQEQVITADTGYTALSRVTVGAISSTYVGSDITSRTGTDLSVNGATITVPSGYYASQQTKSVTIGSVSLNAPTISSSGLITSSSTFSTGYIGTAPSNKTLQLTTKAGTTIAPTESIQTAIPAGTYATGDIKIGAISNTYIGSGITQKTESDLSVNGATVTAPAGMYANDVSATVQSGSVTVATPTVSSSGLITASATVSDGYITGNPSNKTLQMTTKGATTITPTTSQQTAISSGTYATGDIVVNPIPSQYIVPSGSETKTENGTYNVTSLSQLVVAIPIQHYYTGSTAPASSLGANGDIYLKA